MADEPQTTTIIVPERPKLIRLSDIALEPDPPRLPTGIDGLDKCLAETDDLPGGLPRGVSVLLAGMPGSCKSTMAAYMLMGAQPHGETIMGHGEVRANMVKKMFARLKFDAANPVLHHMREAEELLDVIRETTPALVVVDSVQTLTLGGKKKYDDQYEACELLAGQVCSNGGTIVFISHVNKTGSDHKGSADLPHLVDIHMHMTVSAKNNKRHLEMRKNRYGRAGFSVDVNVGVSSLTVGAPVPLNSKSSFSMGEARSNLEKAALAAYEGLVAGKSLNGWSCLGDPDLSAHKPGMWRAGLEMAVGALVRDGYELGAEKVNGRLTHKVLKWPSKAEDAALAAEPDAVPDGNDNSGHPSPDMPIEMK